MNIFFWICRGLSKPCAVRELTDLVSNKRPRINGLFETKINASRLRNIQQRLGFKNGFIVERNGITGDWHYDGLTI